MSCLVVLLGALCALNGGCGDHRSAFEVIGLESNDSVLARNEAITLQFNAEIDPSTTFPVLILVKADGDPLDVVVTASGGSLLLLPLSGLWPEKTQLDIEIRRGLALAIKSSDGRDLEKGFRGSMTVGDQVRDQGLPFTLLDIQIPPEKKLEASSVFRFEFSLAISPQSLAQALRLSDEAGKTRIPPYTLEDNGRILTVMPFGRGSPAGSDQTWLLELRNTLTSSSGRRMEGESRRFPIQNSPASAREGVVVFDFDADALPPSRSALSERLKGPARPQRSDLAGLKLYGEYRFRPKGGLVSAPFSSEPSSLQFVIPGQSLGQEPALIAAFSFFAFSLPSQRPQFPRILIRIGEARSGLPQIGLSDDRALNWQGATGRFETIPKGSVLGEWSPNVDRYRELVQGPGYGWIEIPLDRPFFYRGEGRDLLIEIENPLGVIGSAPSFEADGFEIAGGNPLDNGPKTAVLTMAGTGKAQKLVLATKIRLERYIDIVSTWQDVPSDALGFFRVPSDRDIEAKGRVGVDFRFSYQSQDDEGHKSAWGQLEALGRCRKIRARLEFLADSTRAARGDVAVRRLRIRYRR